jgi:hypothetical protein
MVKDGEQTEFNDAVNHINRVNGLIAASNVGKVDLNIYVWFHCLVCLFLELSTYMKDAEVQRFRTLIRSISSEVEKQNMQNQRTNKNMIPSSLYFTLFDFELELRDVYKKSGLQIKVVSDTERFLK